MDSKTNTDRNLSAYYYSFEPTGCDLVDAVLESVANAGAGYHNTEDWREERDDGSTPLSDMQAAANKSAAAVLELIMRNKELANEVTVVEFQKKILGEGLKKDRAEIDKLKAENETLRATTDLQKLLPEVSDALEELELHGLHSDQGYRKLKDWYRKVGLAYRVIQGPMFGAEHGELVSQNTWLRSIVEHYAQQHAPLEPIPDSDGWSTRLPGYDLPALLRDAERYRFIVDCPIRTMVALSRMATEADFDLSAECDQLMSKIATRAK